MTYVLLFAIQLTVIPLHQLIHKHNNIAVNTTGNAFTLKKYEKPCCKPFEAFIAAKLTAADIIFINQPAFTVYIVRSLPLLSFRFFQSANKAPPLEIA